MPIATRVNSLNINLLTQAQFNEAEKDPNQIYMITDAPNNANVDSELSNTSTNPVQNKVINEALLNKANVSVSVVANLTVDGWIVDGEAHRQILTINGITPTRNGVAGVSQTATDDQCKQAASAMLRIVGQGNNQLIIKALGDVPSINIPLEIILL